MNTALQIKEETQTPVVITPMSLIARAQETNASIEQMQQLFELQLRYEDNEARKAYYRAVSAFKAEAITISKDGAVGYTNKDGSFTGYKHATLGNVVNTLTPHMSKHGLSLTWDVKQEVPTISVTCRMTHEMGHSTEVTMSAGKDDSGKKNSIQQIASTVSYLQRYTALAITGTATSEQDDDGRGSDPEPKDNGFMPVEQFNRSFPKWEQGVLSKAKTPQGMVDFLVGKGAKFSPEQINIILAIKGA